MTTSAVETTLSLRNMSCQHCVRAVEGVLRAVPGVRVTSVEVGRAVIATDGAPPMDAIRAAVQAEGYELT